MDARFQTREVMQMRVDFLQGEDLLLEPCRRTVVTYYDAVSVLWVIEHACCTRSVDDNVHFLAADRHDEVHHWNVVAGKA